MHSWLREVASQLATGHNAYGRFTMAAHLPNEFATSMVSFFFISTVRDNSSVVSLRVSEGPGQLIKYVGLTVLAKCLLAERIADGELLDSSLTLTGHG